MKPAAQPPLLIGAGVCNLIAGGFNLLIGFFYLFLCYGIVVMPVGIWQMVVGGFALTGKRVPSHLAAGIAGAVGALITFDILGMMMSIVAAGLVGFEMTQPIEE